MSSLTLSRWCLLVFAFSANAQDAPTGALLYQTYCAGCHTERVHERVPGRSIVTSRAALESQVRRWAGEIKRTLSADEIRDIVDYLDRSYYRFSKPE